MECLIHSPSNLSWKHHQFKPVGLQSVHVGPGFIPINGRARRASVACLVVSTPGTKEGNIYAESSKPGSRNLDEAAQRKWRKMMKDIETSGSAVPILRSLRKRGEPLPRDLVLGTLVRFKQLKRWKIIAEIIEWLRCQHWWVFNEMDFNMLISAYGKQGDFERAERALRSMKRCGFSLNVVTYTALIEAYGRAGHYKKAESIFKRMQSSGPEPSVLTFQTMIKVLVEGKKFAEAEEIFHGILNDEKSIVKPDQRMFQLMIHMYKKDGKRDQAHKLYGEMVSRGIPISTVTFNSLMTSETDYKETGRIFNQLQHAGFRPDVISYTRLISTYAKARREESAQAVFDEMVDAGVRCYPDLCSYTTLSSTYVNASDMEGAKKFFIRLKRDGIVPNVVTYGTLIKGYAKINNLDKMMKTYEEMRLQGIEANKTIFTNLMDAHGKHIDFGSAVTWFKEMVSSGCNPDEKAKNILLSLAKTGEEKQEALELVGSSKK